MLRRCALATVAVIAVLLGMATAVWASPPQPASGTFTQTAITGFESRSAGPNLLIEQTTTGPVSGTLSGTFEDSIAVVIHPTGRFTAKSTLICECTVAGREGVLELVVVDTGQQAGPDTAVFDGSASVTEATGELAGLRGTFDVHGIVNVATGRSVYTLSGQIHFHR